VDAIGRLIGQRTVSAEPSGRTRLTNVISKKAKNQAHFPALLAMYYNFVRIPSGFGKW
jgi:hypothetical protein